MNENVFTLFSAMSGIRDDLVLDSAAFVGNASAAVGAAVGGKKSGKRSTRLRWPVLGLAASILLVVGIGVSVLGNAFGFFEIFPSINPPVVIPPVGSQPVTGDDTGAEETEPSYDEDYHVEKNDYNDSFTIVYSEEDVKPEYYFADVENGDSTALSREAVERIRATEAYLGVEIASIGEESGYECMRKIGLSYGAGERGVYNMVMADDLASILSLAPYLCDLKSMDRLNLFAGYWGSDFNQHLEIAGKQLIAYNSFLLPDGPAVSFNRALVNQYFTDAELYRLVEEKKWTMETMMGYVTAYGGETDDGDGWDTPSYGLAVDSFDLLSAFFTSSEIRMMKADDKGFVVSALDDVERIQGVEAFAKDLIARTTTNGVYNYDFDSMLKDGSVMFELSLLSARMESGTQSVDVGILPYPLYDVAQTDYRTLYTGGYVALLSDSNSLDMACDVLETLAYQSSGMQKAYEETFLRRAGCGSTVDLQMLRRICRSMTPELMRVLQGSCSETVKMWGAMAANYDPETGSMDVVGAIEAAQNRMPFLERLFRDIAGNNG